MVVLIWRGFCSFSGYPISKLGFLMVKTIHSYFVRCFFCIHRVSISQLPHYNLEGIYQESLAVKKNFDLQWNFDIQSDRNSIVTYRKMVHIDKWEKIPFSNFPKAKKIESTALFCLPPWVIFLQSHNESQIQMAKFSIVFFVLSTK